MYFAGHSSRVVSVEFNHDGTRLVTAAHDGETRIWDTKSGNLVYNLKNEKGPIAFSVFSPDGKYVATASSKTKIAVWKVSSTTETPVALDHDCTVFTASFSFTSGRIVTGCENGSIFVWDGKTGKKLFDVEAVSNSWIRQLSFNADDTRIISADQSRYVYLYDAATGHLVKSLVGKRPLNATPELGRSWGHVVSASFLNDGQRILTANDDGTIHVWDAQSGDEVALVGTDGGYIASAVFLPNDHAVLAISADGSIRKWKLFASTQAFIDATKEKVPRCLTPSQRQALFLEASLPRWCDGKAKYAAE